MGTTVRLLDDTLVDQIAAGEVIERPANLVKELLENAIDAAASVITVSVEDGGRAQVRVTDDGIGMSREDARLSIERHATSKIASFEDLVRVATLGFRGEALPSIGAVSKMTITTRPKADLEGTRVVVEGGALREVSPAGCPPGTSVEVADLFYNVPARKKFLRARQTETSRIFEVCQRIALSHPELRLTVSSDGRTARQYLPARTLVDRAYSIFGEVPLQEIHAKRNGVILEAALAPPELARAGARHLFLLVNGRPITDRALARAIAFAYGERLPPGHYPKGVVSIRVPAEDVDVNAHPQKSEVRFRRSAQLVDLVSRMLASHLPSTPGADAYWDERIGGPGPTADTGPRSERAAPIAAAEQEVRYEARLPNGLRLVAQVRDSLLVCEGRDEVILIDRERADGIRRRDALASAVAEGRVPRQTLLFPDRAELAPAQEDALGRHGSALQSLGFEWSLLGESTYAVRALPTVVADARAAAMFEAAIEAALRNSDDPLHAAVSALGHAGATPNGEPLTGDQARRVAGSIDLSSEEHRACIVARVPLPFLPPSSNDE